MPPKRLVDAPYVYHAMVIAGRSPGNCRSAWEAGPAKTREGVLRFACLGPETLVPGKRTAPVVRITKGPRNSGAIPRGAGETASIPRGSACPTGDGSS